MVTAHNILVEPTAIDATKGTINGVDEDGRALRATIDSHHDAGQGNAGKALEDLVDANGTIDKSVRLLLSGCRDTGSAHDDPFSSDAGRHIIFNWVTTIRATEDLGLRVGYGRLVAEFDTCMHAPVICAITYDIGQARAFAGARRVRSYLLKLMREQHYGGISLCIWRAEKPELIEFKFSDAPTDLRELLASANEGLVQAIPIQVHYPDSEAISRYKDALNSSDFAMRYYAEDKAPLFAKVLLQPSPKDADLFVRMYPLGEVGGGLVDLFTLVCPATDIQDPGTAISAVDACMSDDPAVFSFSPDWLRACRLEDADINKSADLDIVETQTRLATNPASIVATDPNRPTGFSEWVRAQGLRN